MRAHTLLLVLVLHVACSSFQPVPVDEVPFKERAQTRSENGITTTVAVPTPEEARQIFGVNVAKRGIQPVWIRIENGRNREMFFFQISTDPDYFSANEAAYKCAFSFGGDKNKRMADHFEKHQIRFWVQPDAAIEGFVYTNLDLGTKVVTVQLIGKGAAQEFDFVVTVPGLIADHTKVDFKNLYREEELVDLDEKGLRKALEELPRAVTGKRGKGEGDPVNLIVIGHGPQLRSAFMRRRWDETETLRTKTAARTASSSVFGRRYRYSPVSPLYVYGRPQDLALQKARASIHERNHLRLWLSPMRFEGKPVWVGQISRDIGVRLTAKTWYLSTHKIDPDVDETRSFLIQDLIASQRVQKLGLVKGVGAAPKDEPRGNLTGDPYYTDGLRVVFVLTDDPRSFDEIEIFDWEKPRRR